MEKDHRQSLEQLIAARVPEIMEEMRKAGLSNGASIDQVRTVFPVKPGAVEQILGKGLNRSNGHTLLSPENIVQLFVYRNFGNEIRTPKHKKIADKTLRDELRKLENERSRR